MPQKQLVPTMIHSLIEGALVVAVNVIEVPAATETGCGETLRVYAGGVREMLPGTPPQLRRKALIERTTNEAKRRKTPMLASHRENGIMNLHPGPVTLVCRAR